MSTIIDRLSEGKFTLIAEIGVNYYDIAKKEGISAMDAAKLMVKEAKDAGIHAVKFQTYKAGTLAAKASPSYWDLTEESTTSQYELFKKFDSFGYEEYKELKNYCDEIGITIDIPAFISWHNERGWKHGKKCIARDWQKAVRQWYCKDNELSLHEFEVAVLKREYAKELSKGGAL